MGISKHTFPSISYHYNGSVMVNCKALSHHVPSDTMPRSQSAIFIILYFSLTRYNGVAL